MSDQESTDKTLTALLVRLWKSGYTIHYSQHAVVKKVTQLPKENRPGLLTAIIQDAEEESIRWHYPVKPAKGSNCIVMYPANKPSQAFAFGFDKIEEIKATISDDVEINASSGSLEFICGDTNFVSDGSKTTINGNLEVLV